MQPVTSHPVSVEGRGENIPQYCRHCGQSDELCTPLLPSSNTNWKNVCAIYGGCQCRGKYTTSNIIAKPVAGERAMQTLTVGYYSCEANRYTRKRKMGTHTSKGPKRWSSGEGGTSTRRTVRGRRRKKEVSMEGARPPVPWKAKRRRAGVIPDNLVQSRLFNFVSKFPNLKVRGGNTNILAENIHQNIVQNTHSLTDSGVGGCPGGRGRKRKPEDNQTGGKLAD